MTNSISTIGNSASVSADLSKTEISSQTPPKHELQMNPAANAQQTLVIEPISANRYVYKVMDKTTGEVIRQLPNEHVEKMLSDPSYTQGGVVKTSA